MTLAMTAADKKSVVFPVTARYRQNDFDLANVTPENVRTILRNVRTGKLEDQDRLFRLMIDSWPCLRKCLAEVSGAVSHLEIEVKPAKRDDAEDPTPQAQAMYEVVERALESYNPKAGFWELDLKGAVVALIDAYLKGISVLEIVWQLENNIISPRCYAPVPAKYLAYPSTSNEVDRLMIAPNGVNYDTLQDFPADKFLIAVWQQGSAHPIHAASLRSLTKDWLGAIYGKGWLMQFAQLYGIPFRQAKTDGTDAANTKAAEMLENIGSSGWAVTSRDVEIDLGDAPSGNSDGLPQVVLMQMADAECQKLILGQTLTTDVGNSGSRALGEVHQSVRADVLQMVATWVAGIITTQLIPAIVRMNYGAVASEDMPYCEITIPKPKDEKAIAERVKILHEIGLPMSNKWVYEELNVPEPLPDDELFGASNPDNQPLPPENNVDLTPDEGMIDEVKRALEANKSADELTGADIIRAQAIARGDKLTPRTVRAMHDGFTQLKAANSGKQRTLWQSMGGEAGYAWITNKAKQLFNL